MLPIGQLTSFVLAEGEMLCLHLDEALDRRSEKTLARALGTSVGVAAPAKSRRLSFGKMMVGRFLAKHVGVNRDITTIMNSMGVAADAPLRFLGLTHRLLLGFEAARSVCCVVLCSVSGLDPLGVQKVLSYISQNLQGRGAIFLSYPSTLGRTCLHSGNCFAVF